jgi:hypothetical protein
MSIQFSDHDEPVTTCALIDPNRMHFQIAIHSAGCSKPNSRETWVVMLDDVGMPTPGAVLHGSPRVNRGVC